MNTYELFEQDRIWITKDSMPILLTEMDAHHRAATLAMLRRRADYNCKMYFRTLAWMMLRGELAISAAGEVFDRDGMHVTDNNEVEINITPEEWLEKRPLIMELSRLVANDGAIEGEVVDAEVEAKEIRHPVRRAIEL